MKSEKKKKEENDATTAREGCCCLGHTAARKRKKTFYKLTPSSARVIDECRTSGAAMRAAKRAKISAKSAPYFAMILRR